MTDWLDSYLPRYLLRATATPEQRPMAGAPGHKAATRARHREATNSARDGGRDGLAAIPVAPRLGRVGRRVALLPEVGHHGLEELVLVAHLLEDVVAQRHLVGAGFGLGVRALDLGGSPGRALRPG